MTTPLALSGAASDGIPVYLVRGGNGAALPPDLPPRALAWAAATGFDGRKGTLCPVPGEAGEVACVLFGLGSDPRALDAGRLARLLPAGDYRLAGEIGDGALAALGWLLGAYRFERYRKPEPRRARLIPPAGVDRAALERTARACYLVRDLVNTPASDLGPAELEQAVRELGREFGAEVSAVVGDALLAMNFPMVHAVGRASASPPRVVDLRWGGEADPKVTLVGKGVCFDTGGLNIKPGDSMALMKKDMGGAANVLGLARMIMAARLPVRLRVIVAAVENAISGNAFRPGDVLNSRKGITVEIGNTDAEGRLVLGDALAWGDEEAPQVMIDMATLTGAARVALGPDLPALFTDDEGFAAELAAAGGRLEDPMWRLPLWKGYAANLSSEMADVSHISKGPFAGSITAALFLQKFVEKAALWAHFDLFAWVATEKPAAPVGGEAQCIRALFEVIAARYPSR
ncbi:MAG: leucyl aminopeptidase [Alphaproteobacteria bacterium]|nr:MAG: leucyl aminopeptidase [Alphaproteobacteria bacterium]